MLKSVVFLNSSLHLLCPAASIVNNVYNNKIRNYQSRTRELINMIQIKKIVTSGFHSL